MASLPREWPGVVVDAEVVLLVLIRDLPPTAVMFGRNKDMACTGSIGSESHDVAGAVGEDATCDEAVA